MRLLDDLHVRRIRREHPYRNLQTLSGGFLDGHRAISAFRFADHLKAETVEWVERIENTNVLGFRAQGIVSVVTFILTSIVSFHLEAWRPVAHTGYVALPHSSYPWRCFSRFSAESSSTDWSRPLLKTA